MKEIQKKIFSQKEEPEINRFELMNEKEVYTLFVNRETYDFFHHIMREEFISQLKDMPNAVTKGDYTLIFDERDFLCNVIYNGELYLPSGEDEIVYSRFALEHLAEVILDKDNKTYSCAWIN